MTSGDEKLRGIETLFPSRKCAVMTVIIEVYYMKGREPEWSNSYSQIEDGKLPEMPQNHLKLIHSVKTKL